MVAETGLCMAAILLIGGLHGYPKLASENAARAVRAVQGQVPTPGYLPP